MNEIKNKKQHRKDMKAKTQLFENKIDKPLSRLVRGKRSD